MMSISTLIRNQGNECFRQASLTSSCTPQKTRQLYEQALSCYYRAKERAENSDEESSAAKNIGKAAWKIAGMLTKTEKKSQTIVFYLHEAIKGLCTAYNGSRDCKSREWRSEVLETLNVCLQEVIDASDKFGGTDSKISHVESLVSLTSVDMAAADLQLKLATLYFQDGATKLQNGDYKKCLSRMRDCYRPIEEVKRLGHVTGELDDQVLLESEMLEQDVFYHTCSASSIQARVQGSRLLAMLLEDREDLDMNLVFEVIDWFKQAVVLARELEIEQEAIAESRLGLVYDKVLKMKTRAKAYFKHCFQLAESLKPRVFTSEDWYKDCIGALRRYQEEARRQEEEEKKNTRATFLEELKVELADIRAHNTSGVALIQHVFNNYPPKKPTWKKPSEEDMNKWEDLRSSNSKEYKKVLIKALAVYHPDKVDDKQHGMKWKVLCEEITKMITNYYETTKSL